MVPAVAGELRGVGYSCSSYPTFRSSGLRSSKVWGRIPKVDFIGVI